MRTEYYKPTFARALWSYAASGFHARDLDADDWDFIEGIRRRGCLESAGPVSMISDRIVLPEEVDLWVPPPERRIAVLRRVPLDPEEAQARREKRQRDKELMAAALAEERAAWEAAQELKRQNQLRRLQDDIEWVRRSVRAKPNVAKVIRRQKQTLREEKAAQARAEAARVVAAAQAVLAEERELARQEREAKLAVQRSTAAQRNEIKRTILAKLNSLAPGTRWTFEDIAIATLPHHGGDHELLKLCIGELLTDGLVKSDA